MTFILTAASCLCRAGSGVLVALGADIAGRVPLTEIHDALVPNAVEGLKPGQAVRANVLQAAHSSGPSKKAGRHQLSLSLRPSKGGAVAGLKKPKAALPEDAAVPVSLQASDLSANQQVTPARSEHLCALHANVDGVEQPQASTAQDALHSMLRPKQWSHDLHSILCPKQFRFCQACQVLHSCYACVLTASPGQALRQK